MLDCNSAMAGLKRPRSVALLAMALSVILTGTAAAETVPGRLADLAVGDPLSDTPDCLAAKEDARAWDERKGKSALKAVGRVIIWPLGERAARRGKRAKNEARELVVDRLRETCFTRPDLGRAGPIPGQRRPMGQGYRGGAAFVTGAGGYRVKGIVHPTLNTIYLSPLDGVAVEGATPDDWALLAAKVISPAGCQVAEAWSGPAKTGEVAFVCPPGVSLLQLVTDQAERVVLGAPLKLRP